MRDQYRDERAEMRLFFIYISFLISFMTIALQFTFISMGGVAADEFSSGFTFENIFGSNVIYVGMFSLLSGYAILAIFKKMNGILNPKINASIFDNDVDFNCVVSRSSQNIEYSAIQGENAKNRNFTGVT